MIEDNGPRRDEPIHCTEGRIIDAISWIVKAQAQLSVVSDIRADEVSRILSYALSTLTVNYKEMACNGSVIGKPAHEMMIEHALYNAAGHARYAGHPMAEILFDDAQDLAHESIQEKV